MRATIQFSAQYQVSQDCKLPASLGVVFPTFGPFTQGAIEGGELAGGANGPTINLGGLAQVEWVALTGNATIEWDYNAATETFDNEIRVCGLATCATCPQVLIPLPVCGIQHLRIVAGAECGIEWEFGHFGYSPPA